mmetsp:Transcript_36826/g.86006  ORF Transcript_36826/g.86006 Transcript_36826/m.86006 type:complete len:361 (-) Transcript_36826:416-1498(-)
MGHARPRQWMANHELHRRAQGSVPAAFIMLKGYHMGSLWLAQTFNSVPGCALFFEYEHCLRKLSPSRMQAAYLPRNKKASITQLASPNLTLRFLRTACACPVAERASAMTAGDSMCSGCSMNEPSGANRHRTLCRATGVSLAAMGNRYTQHLHAVRILEPRVRILVQVRTNHVKHALSFLRTNCGDPNHSKRDKRAKMMMRVPAALLLARTRQISREQRRVVEVATQLANGSITRYVMYEAMQRDMAGEVAAILEAVGAPPLPPGWSSTIPSSQVKSGAEDVSRSVSNYEELERAFRFSECLHAMLVAREPQTFLPFQGCAEAVRAPAATPAQFGRRRFDLNASDCIWGPVSRSDSKGTP